MNKFLSLLLIISFLFMPCAFASDKQEYTFVDSTGKSINFKVSEKIYNTDVIKQNINNAILSEEITEAYSVNSNLRTRVKPAITESKLKKTGKITGFILLLPLSIPLSAVAAAIIFISFPFLYYGSKSGTHSIPVQNEAAQ